MIFNNNSILSTEHGPKGGDEVNLILSENFDKIENYGWPISSYGDHYDSVSENSNLKKNRST